jgi:hypothetical protein
MDSVHMNVLNRQAAERLLESELLILTGRSRRINEPSCLQS